MDGSTMFDADGRVDLESLSAITALDATAWEKGEIGPRPTMQWVPVSMLCIDSRYQRGIGARGTKLIRSMVAGWRWELCGLIVCTKLDDGRYEIVDGQHRSIGAATLGIERLPAVVMNCATVDERARIFVSVNSARVATTPAQKLRAAIASRDREAVAIDRIARKAGVQILASPPHKGEFGVGETLAASSLLKTYRTWGETVLRRTLAFCVAARLAPIRTDHLIGLGTLLGEEPWKGSPIDVQKLVAALEDWDAVYDRAELARMDASTTKAVSIASELYRRACSEPLRRCA